MNKKKSKEINAQIEYGLDEVDPKRTISIRLKDFLFFYKSIAEFRRFFHQPMHYPTLLSLNVYLGNRKAGAYSIMNKLVSKTLYKYLPEDILEEIENGNKLTHPEYPYYYELKRDKKFKLGAAGNTEPPAFELIKEMGFEISKNDHFYTAENYNATFIGESPLELLGLITLYQAKGDTWRVSDDKIDQFIAFDEDNS